jgi:deoxyribodipyrimidine photolyase-related protein
MTTLRLILGDQLNPHHPWFDDVREDVAYVLMEVRQETDYVLHHAQKIIAIFAAMRDFAQSLRAAGHRVHYLPIDDPDNAHAITVNLDRLIARDAIRTFEYQAPDEWRLDAQLADYAQRGAIVCTCVESAHFYTARDEAAAIFAGRPHWLMEDFYRRMRVKHGVLLEAGDAPAGGQWNFDHDNRKPWRGQPQEPFDKRPLHDHGALWDTIVAAGVKSFGRPQATRFVWPLNRREALAFALNTKMLAPQEVVARAEAAWRSGHAPLAAVEGFVRQILGWREYVRGVYWAHMPGYTEQNTFGHTLPLPRWFWDGRTRMRCLAHAVGQSLDDAHAHHIQRLMVIGNFALLAGCDPQAVHAWYLGVYIDAFEWVEAPNTLGMSQFVDGGQLATKPYVSSAAYIDRMSDYCKGCHYDKRARLGERACPFNALYWDFFLRNEAMLSVNRRLAMPYRQLAAMSAGDRAALQAQAADLRSRLDEL